MRPMSTQKHASQLQACDTNHNRQYTPCQALGVECLDALCRHDDQHGKLEERDHGKRDSNLVLPSL